ncbi:MAG: HEPN domain-containing protein [Aquificaceae bacterium]|uniref:HEPN domain-containing protein n=1 Tax=Hydrogenobacter sp. Uz 6-8 TaxID=3384828 RepID=UPI0030A33AE4
MNRWKDWWEQALRDREKAELDLEHGYYEWACFTAQQSAEKALKAFSMYKGFEPWGHSLLALLKALRQAGFEFPPKLESSAKRLDLYYIPTRYPNGLPAGKPSEYYTEEEAIDALNACDHILRWCKTHIPEEG